MTHFYGVNLADLEQECIAIARKTFCDRNRLVGGADVWCPDCLERAMHLVVPYIVAVVMDASRHPENR